MKREIYVSVDVETDGQAPALNSMIQLGASAFVEAQLGGFIDLGTFEICLQTLSTATPDPSTIAWWNSDPKRKQQYEKIVREAKPVEPAIRNFVDWLFSIKPRDEHEYQFVFCGSPTGFDFTFVYWYLIAFNGRSPFTHRALDLRSMIKGLTAKPYFECHKSEYPSNFVNQSPHDALQDAIEQAEVFKIVMMESARKNIKYDVQTAPELLGYPTLKKRY